MLVMAGFALAEEPKPTPLTPAQAAAKKANAKKAAAAREYSSKNMARAATEEIFKAARETVARAEADIAVTEELLVEKIAALKAAVGKEAIAKATAEKADVEQAVAKKTGTLQRAIEKAAFEEANAVKAAAGRYAAKADLAVKTATALAATREVLVKSAEAAKAAAAKACGEETAARKLASEKAGDEKAAAEKELAKKVAATQAAAKKVTTTEAAIRQSDAIAARDVMARAVTEKMLAQRVLDQKTAAHREATKTLAAADNATNQAAVQKAAEEEATAEKAVAQSDAVLRPATAKAAEALAVAQGGLTPLSADAWDYAKARHLLVRAGFGGTTEQVAKLHAMGLHGAVDFLVDYRHRPATNIAFRGSPLERPEALQAKLGLEAREQYNYRRREEEDAQAAQLRRWWLKRMVESPRPLQEKLTMFWHGHFATQYSVVPNSFAFYRQNQMLREHAGDNFGSLLYGIVHDAVMIRYLDNNKNVKGHPNENLAREIMELFAMGVDQGYTENDIREAARALTGYTFENYSAQFRFNHAQHDTGKKTIFGKTGNWTGDDLVKLILDQPATARFLGRRLFEFFAYREPSEETVDRLAAVLRANRYDLAPFLRHLFVSEEFYSTQAMGTQIKSPVQLVVGMLRDLGVKEIVDYAALDEAVQSAGQQLFEPPDVKGWRRGHSWISADRTFVRYNSVADLLRTVPVAGGRQGVDLVALLDSEGCKTAVDIVNYLAKTCCVGPLNDKKREKFIGYVSQLPPASEWAGQRVQVNEKLRALLVLMMSMPEYQLT
ncbi:MAG TPA: DUF1800 family protein [Pirellulaceae bacterium]|nr:DUF1800 family protein [Pirellulaceae bacterium]